jgi:hypothetical protein
MKPAYSVVGAVIFFERSLALPQAPKGISIAPPLLEKRAPRDCGTWKMKCGAAAGACNNACYYINCINKGNRKSVSPLRLDRPLNTNEVSVTGSHMETTAASITGYILAAPRLGRERKVSISAKLLLSTRARGTRDRTPSRWTAMSFLPRYGSVRIGAVQRRPVYKLATMIHQQWRELQSVPDRPC